MASKQAIIGHGNSFERIKVVERKVLYSFINLLMLTDTLSPTSSIVKLPLSTSIMALAVFKNCLPNKILGVLGVHVL